MSERPQVSEIHPQGGRDKRRRTLIKSILAPATIGAALTLVPSDDSEDTVDATIAAPQAIAQEADDIVVLDEGMTSSIFSAEQGARLTAAELKSAGDIPRASFVREGIHYPKPEGIEAEDQDFELAAKRFSDHVESELIPKLKRSFDQFPKYKQIGTPRERIIVHFLTECIKLAEQDPVLGSYMKRYEGHMGLVKGAKILKPLFLKGGLYFTLNKVATVHPETQEIVPNLSMRAYKVQSGEMWQVQEKTEGNAVQMLILGDTVFDLDDTRNLGEQDFDLNMALIFSDNFDIERKVRGLKEIGIQDKRLDDIETLKREYLVDTKRHEVTHSYLQGRFPHEYLTSYSPTYPVRIPVQLEDEEGSMAYISGEYRLVDFHEMCAIGSELAHSESDFPLSSLDYIGSSDNPAYGMVSRVFPTLAIQYMENGPKKERIIGHFKTGKTLPSNEFANLMVDELTVDARRHIGYNMYKICFEILEAIDRGELMPAQVPVQGGRQ